jgi:hypothetical protein
VTEVGPVPDGGKQRVVKGNKQRVVKGGRRQCGLRSGTPCPYDPLSSLLWQWPAVAVLLRRTACVSLPLLPRSHADPHHDSHHDLHYHPHGSKRQHPGSGTHDQVSRSRFRDPGSQQDSNLPGSLKSRIPLYLSYPS